MLKVGVQNKNLVSVPALPCGTLGNQFLPPVTFKSVEELVKGEKLVSLNV